MWFFSKYPEGAIRKGLVGKSDTSAIFECRLYANRNDEKDNFIANGFAERIIRPGDSIGEKFLECGETAATSRALDAAGFTFLGCNSDMDEVIEPLPYEENKPSEKKQEKPKKTTKKKEKNVGMDLVEIIFIIVLGLREPRNSLSFLSLILTEHIHWIILFILREVPEEVIGGYLTCIMRHKTHLNIFFWVHTISRSQLRRLNLLWINH